MEICLHDAKASGEDALRVPMPTPSRLVGLQYNTDGTSELVNFSFFQEYLDKAETYRQTEAYRKAMSKRRVWVEPLFGEAKEFHRGL